MRIINVTQTKFIVKMKPMIVSIIKKVILLGFTTLAGACGDLQGDSNSQEGFPVPLPLEEIILTSSISYGPIERESAAYEMQTSAVISVPVNLTVLRGNSGVGFASLTINNRKFCYQGSALNESDINGESYFFRYEKVSPVSTCVVPDGGETVFDDEVEVNAGDRISFEIESPGCSVEEGTCVFTEARAVLNVVETRP